MTTAIERLSLLITANADGLISTLREVGATSTATFAKVEGDAEAAGAGAGTKFGGGLNSGVVTGLATVAATMAAFKGVAFAKDAVSTAVDFNVATAQVNATLKATADVSGATAGGIDRMASSIENTQQIFAGTVKQGAALLLTFTDIRNQAGSGNNIFDRALQVSSAASNVLGKDLNTTIIQIGKALENPQTSLTNLQRSGLALNEIDKQRIINLAKQGDLLGAQSALLDALEAKGLIAAGEAVAKANPLQQFQVASQELKKTLGEDLLPAATDLLKIFEGVFGAIEHFPAPLRESVELLTVAGALVVPLLALRRAGSALTAISQNAKTENVADGAAAVDAAGTSAATKITESATTLGAEAASGAEKLAAAAPILGAALKDGAAAVAAASAPSKIATPAVESTAASSGEAIAAGADEGALALHGAAADLFSRLTEGAGELTAAGDAIATKLAAVADLQAAGQATSLDRAFAAPAAQQQLIAVDSAGIAEIQGAFATGATEIETAISTGALELTGAATSLGTSIGGGAAALELAGAGIASKIVEAGTVAATEIGAASTGGALTNLGSTAGGGVLGANIAGAGNSPYGPGLAATGAGETSALTGLAEGGSVVGVGLGAKYLLGGSTSPGIASALPQAAETVAPEFAATGAAVGGGLFGLGAGSKALGASSFLGQEAGSLGALGGGAGLPSLSLGLGGFAAAGLAGYEAFKRTSDLIGPTQKSFQQLTGDAKGFADELHHANADNIFQKFANFGQAKSDFKAANAGFTQLLDTQGPTAAAQAFEKFQQSVVAAGGSATDVAVRLKPFIDNLVAAESAESAAQRSADAYSASLETLSSKFADIKTGLQISNDLATIPTAATQLASDKADAAGTGPKAASAADAVVSAYTALSDQSQTNIDDQQRLTDAYTSLQDAQTRIITSTQSLTQARQALALYDSPRGEKERALQLDIISRRVVTTPAESDQKQLDLLQNADNNGNKQQQLQDAVLSAASSQRDAYRSVADAQNAIAKAQQTVDGEAAKTKAEFDKLKKAIAETKTVHNDAEKAIVADQKTIQGALLQTATDLTTAADAPTQAIVDQIKLLDTLAAKYAPGSDLSKNIHALLLAASQALATTVAASAPIKVNGQAFAPPTSPVPPSAVDKSQIGPPGTGETQNPSTQNVKNLLRGHAVGGPVMGNDPTGIPILAHPHEYVIQRSAVEKYGTAAMAAINSGSAELPKFAVGGAVDAAMIPAASLPRYELGGVVLPKLSPTQAAPHAPSSFVQTIHQNNTFNGQAPATADLDYANRELGWRLSRGGRR